MKVRLWDYDTGTGYEYARSGSCNGCTLCCQGVLRWQVCSPSELLACASDLGGGLWTNGSGQWQEIDTGANHVYRKYLEYTRNAEMCPSLLAGRCNAYDARSMYCRTFPLTPLEVSDIPECSYRFTITGSYTFDV